MVLVAVFAVLLAGAVLRTRMAPSSRSRETIRWGDAWLKAAVIFTGITLFVVYLPAQVMALDAVAELDRAVQDLVGAGVWSVALGGSLMALVWLQRRELI